MQATGKSQQPWVSSSPIRGSFYFAGLTPSPQTSEPAAPPPPARAWFGARIQAVTEELAEGLGVEPKGAVIADVNDSGPARRAGLQVGDVIIGFDGKSVTDARELARFVGETQPATNIEIVILREGREIRKMVGLGRLDESHPAASPPSTKDAQPDKPVPIAPPPGTKTVKILGLDLAGLTDRLREYYNIQATTQGVVVTAYASAEPDKRMSAGDVVLEVSGTAVANVADVQGRIEELRKSGKKVVLLRVASRNSNRFVALKLR
jgi:serine protease Do